MTGSGEAVLDGRARKLTSSSVILLNPRDSLEIHHVRGGVLKWYEVSFDIWTVAETDGHRRQVLTKETSPWWKNDEVGAAYSGGLAALAAQIAGVWRAGGESADFHVDSLFKSLLHRLAKAGSETPLYEPEQRIREAVAYIRDHYRENITRQSLSQRCGLTPEYFSSMFNKAKGQTYAEYLARVRIAKAKEQLFTTKGTLDPIAHNVGYADGLYLSRKFKQ